MSLKKLFKKIKEYNQLTNFMEIARRYFAVNSFDGILTILGVLVGNFTAGVKDSQIIISTGIATSIAMGISGISGTYFSEQAERKKKLKHLEKHTLSKLTSTKLGRSQKIANTLVALTNGLAPFITGVLLIFPFLFVSDINAAYIISFAASLLYLVGLGAFLGHLSEENVLIYSAKMFVTGLVCFALLFILRIR
ncbi:hypothetical protein GF327_05010 [Candidatus Woesearchaeota archaeon]|nr:hypothetical protein [Candidatus Woesearchaeota archaeon]